jgi:antitoxin component YwqK of YwqJK toxin-antitoxin module
MRIFNTIALFVFFMITNPIYSQNKLENGKKTGHWEHKDNQGLVYAEGEYNNDFRSGAWKFYVSEHSRNNHQPDVSGTYSDNGIKEGKWLYTNFRTETSVQVDFTNDLMQGECLYSDKNNSILARGLMVDGIRHGKWIFYDANNPTGASHPNGLKLNKVMSEGFYKDGLRIGSWAYDYFLDVNTHVKGNLSFENSANTGRLDFYKIEQHPTFGLSETLAGSGAYSNGKKVGRWIEFNHGTKGDFIETGNYDENGKRNGLWKIRIAHQTYLAGSYNNGIPHGKFNHYYDNGQLKYESTFNNGLEEGEFKRYYKNGQLQEQGTHVIISNETTRDTTFLSLKLAYEQHFLLIEEDFSNIHYEYVTWLEEPGYSIAPSELDRRFDVYRTYGFEAQPRVANITVKSKKTVREGDYLSFYEDGGLKLKGIHSPHTASLFNPNERTVVQTYARTGEWKEYGEDQLLKNTYIYEDGKLKKMLDANGYIVHSFKYEANSVNMIDSQGNTITIGLD